MSVFGDTFEDAGVGGPGWRSPVVLFGESATARTGIVWTGAAGPDDYAHQVLAYEHGSTHRGRAPALHSGRRGPAVPQPGRMATALARHHSPSPEELFATLEEMTMLDSTVHGPTALLVYDDLAAAQEYLVRVFGLTAGPLQRDGDGRVVYAEIRAGDQVMWLCPAAEGYQSPRTLGAVTGMTVVAVEDADAHHARSVAAGAEIIDAPADQEYGVRVREYGARDLEGQLWFFYSLLD